jgi:hypothetical protein
MIVMAVIVAMAARVVRRRRLCEAGHRLRRAALDDLVQLAAVELDAAAIRAIVDLYPLPFRHDQRSPAGGTAHGGRRASGHDHILRGWSRRRTRGIWL